MKKILMSVVGIGLGHATRSESIYNCLRKKSKVKVLSYGDAYKYYKKINIPTQDFGGHQYKGEEFTFNIMLQITEFFKNPTKLGTDYARFRKYADEFKPDYIFLDSEPNAFFYATKREIPNSVLTNLITTLTHYDIIPKKLKTKAISLQNVLLKRLMKFMLNRGDKFFVPSFERELKYIEKVEYTDLIIRKKPSELKSRSKLKKKIGINKEFYYVHVGGADIERYIYHIFENVLSKFPDKFFVISSNYATRRVIKKENMIIYPFIKNALEYISLSNGVISPAGHSGISEAIVFKKPILAIPVRNHIEQLVNAALLKKEEFGEACFFEKRVSAKALRESLKKFFKKEDEIRSNLKKVKFRGEGAKQIANAILRF